MEGSCEGIDDGEDVGLAVGGYVGRTNGADEGRLVGAYVLVFDGCDDGEFDFTDGIVVGCLDGLVVDDC